MKIRKLDPGTLARLLGDHRANPSAPDELAPTVVGILDLTPFLIPPDAAEVSATIPAIFTPLGTGRIRVLPIANPAAGAEFNVVVPAGLAWQPIVFFTRFIASATVAARRLRLDFLDNTAIRILLVPTLTVVNASEGWDISWAAGINSRLASGGDLISGTDIPNYLLLGPGFTLRTLTANLQAGDTYTEGRLLLREYAV